MAMIACPECGKTISDKAPTCPHCGVEIAGKTTTCQRCGKVYFRSLASCPVCHAPNNNPIRAKQVPPGMPPIPPKPSTSVPPKSTHPKKISQKAIPIAVIVLLLTGGIAFYTWQKTKEGKENEAYEYAMGSDEIAILQSYLDNYGDENELHKSAILSRLNQIKQTNTDWNNAVISGSKELLEEFLDKYPNSPHNAEAARKIDSIDWQTASIAHTVDAMQRYIEAHANGEHVDEAESAIKEIKLNTIMPEERDMIATIFRRFFQSVNAKNEEGLTNTVTPVMISFLGKSNATKEDVVTFLRKIYKDDIISMDWQPGSDYAIAKKEVGADTYEYAVKFSASQEILRMEASGNEHNSYIVNATVGPEGKISAFNMTRVIQP